MIRAKNYDTASAFVEVMLKKISGLFFSGHDVDSISSTAVYLQGGPKNWTILNVDNFAIARGRKACDMSKVCKFCIAKSVKLA